MKENVVTAQIETKDQTEEKSSVGRLNVSVDIRQNGITQAAEDIRIS